MYKANHKHNYRSKVVMLAYAGIQNLISTLDSRFHGKDNGILSSVTKGLCLSLLIISPHSIGATPGVTPGEFSVDASGSANYTVPIAVPPGTAGMQPSLTLSYNSRSGNGLLGVGWTLGGLSVITRCPRTKVIDGVVDGISLDGDDRFCIDGQRLIQVTGSVGDYGNNDIEYRTEVDGFTKVISKGTAGTGPEHFIAYTKSGQILEYGNTADSRIEAVDATTGTQSSEVRLWAVNKIEDTVGNYLTVTYSEDSTNGSYKPVEIAYTGFDNGTTISSPYNEVQFEYEARETIEGGETKKDEITLFFAGSKVKNTERLTNIKTYSDSTLVRDYQLDYDNDGAANRSRLTSITECDGQTTSNCFKPTIFTMQENSGNTISQDDYALGNYAGGGIVSTGDYNGDGLTDFISYDVNSYGNWNTAYNRHMVQLSNGDGTFNQVNTALGNYYGGRIGATGDFNGDGLTDFISYEASTSGNWNSAYSTHKVQLSDGDGTFTEVDYQLGNYSGGKIATTGDFNGDGLTDFISYDADGNGNWNSAYNRQFVHFSDGDGTFTEHNYELGDYAGGYIATTGDFNGDGLTDFISYEASTSGNWNSAYNRHMVHLSNGDGTFSQVNYALGNYAGGKIAATGDFNGDGLTDFISYDADGNGNWNSAYNRQFVHFSDGDGTFTEHNYELGDYAGGYIATTGDFNGDGLTDFISYDANSSGNWNSAYNRQFVHFSDGDGTFTEHNYELGDYAGGKIATTGDFNGDGLTDFISYDANGSGNWNSAYNRHMVHLPDGPITDITTKITGSLGTDTLITYKPITDNSVYTKGGGPTYPVISTTYPEVDIQGPVYVVSKVTVDDGIGGTRDTDYTYTEAKSSLDGRGFLGFKTMTAVDSSTGIKTKTTYSQTHPYIGLVERTEQRLSNDDLIGEVDTTFLHQQTHAGVEVDTKQTPPHPGVLFPYAASVTKKDYEIE